MKVMQYSLAAANYMNPNSYSQGFKIDTIERIAEVKSADGK